MAGGLGSAREPAPGADLVGRRAASVPREEQTGALTPLQLLAAFEHQLAASDDYDDVMSAVGTVAIPTFADWAVLELAPGPHALRALAIHVHGSGGSGGNAAAVSSREALAAELESLLPARADWAPVARLAERRGAEVVAEPLEAWLAAGPDSGGRSTELLHRLGAGSALAVPLVAAGELLGLLTLVSAAPDRYQTGHLGLAGLIGQRAGTAIAQAWRSHQAQLDTRARGELCAMATHDLQNGIAAILMRAARLLAETAGPSRVHLESIEQTARYLIRLSDDLLASARLQPGHAALVRRSHPVAPLLSEIQERLAPLAEQRQVRLTVEAAPDLPPMCCDREQLLRVLSNLVDNALKFTQPGGSVTMCAEGGDGSVRVSVRDDGIGMTESQLPHVFERYWKRDRHGRGTGLGLYIAKEIVSAHGGTIGVASAPGGGTRFFFTIPAA